MTITYTANTIKNRKKQPLLKVDRVKYRSHRDSQQENVETNLLKIDLSRILNDLNAVDDAVLVDLRYLIGDISDQTESTDLQGGLSYEVPDLQIYSDDISQISDLEIQTLSMVSSRLSRLKNKISRLEKDS
jgi:hypothetical protein